jgi:hypothetical protein
VLVIALEIVPVNEMLRDPEIVVAIEAEVENENENDEKTEVETGMEVANGESNRHICHSLATGGSN